MFCSQAQELQQQLAGAIEADGQQKHSHQHTLTLLDQTHMDQLSKLQAQLRHQSQDDSTRQTKLRLELAEQCELAQQAQCRLTELERERGVLQKKKAEDEAVIKMLLKQQTVKDADRISADTLTPADGLDAESKNTQPQETPLLANPVTPAGTMADRTLVLEADVLRRESRLLKDQLATAKAAVQRLTQARREAELQSSAKLSELEGVLSGLEGKQAGAAALLDDTLLAIQSKTSILLQQRQSGGVVHPNFLNLSPAVALQESTTHNVNVCIATLSSKLYSTCLHQHICTLCMYLGMRHSRKSRSRCDSTHAHTMIATMKHMLSRAVQQLQTLCRTW